MTPEQQPEADRPAGVEGSVTSDSPTAGGGRSAPDEAAGGRSAHDRAGGRSAPDRAAGPGNMLPPRAGRRFALERIFVRLVATTGIVGIGVGLGAALADNNVQGWIIGLVVALVSVILAAILWSSRQL